MKIMQRIGTWRELDGVQKHSPNYDLSLLVVILTYSFIAQLLKEKRIVEECLGHAVVLMHTPHSTTEQVHRAERAWSTREEIVPQMSI